MVDSESWERLIVSFFGVDQEWLDHLVLNWNALKNEAGCGCVIEYGEIVWCEGYRKIAEIRNVKARLEELERAEASININDDLDEPLGEVSEKD